MSMDVILGLSRGDEGKGRFVDLAVDLGNPNSLVEQTLRSADSDDPEYTVVGRGTGGANAGHTLVPDGQEPIKLHQIPSGIAHHRILNVIGNGVYVDPPNLIQEINTVKKS